MAKCDLSNLDFAQNCPQNAGNVISGKKISKLFRWGSLWIPLFLERQI